MPRISPYAGLQARTRLSKPIAAMAAGARQMLAVIGDSAYAGSVGVHRALGFVHTGLLKASGWKFGRWLDVVLMQRALGPGSSTEPADDPA